MSNYYDVILLGSDLAGLVAGALLARRGFRVLAVRDAEQDSYQVPGHTLQRSALPILGIDAPAWRRVLTELNLTQSLRRRLLPQRPPFQLVLPDHRIDGDPERSAAELERELPEARDAMEALNARAAELSRIIEPVLTENITLPPDGFWERRELGRLRAHLPDPSADLLSALPADSPARALPAALAAFASDLSPPGPVATLRLLDLFRRGVFRLPGGRDALRALLYERIQTHSGEVSTLDIGELQIKRGRVVSAIARPRGETLGCGFILAGMETQALIRLLGDEAPRRLHAAAREMPAIAYRYVLNLVLSVEGIPEGMGDNSFLVGDPTRPLEEDNALVVHVGEADGEGRCCAQVTALCRTRDPASLADLGRRVRQRLREGILPFLDRHLVVADSPHEGESAAPMLPVYGTEELGPLGVGGTPIATGLKNVFLCGRQTLPGLGLEGELTAGWGAARLISQSEKKRNPLKDNVLHSR